MTNIELDKHGYLANLESWTKATAMVFASEEKIELSAEHWDIINFVRDFYQQYKLFPAIRILIKELRKKLGEQINSPYLYTLFPLGPKQIAKIAGLPKPVRCT